MSRASVLLALAACTTVAPSAQLAAPADLTLDLGADQVRPGERVEVFVQGAPAGAIVEFALGQNGLGPGLCMNQLGGQCLGLLPPVNVLGSAVADGRGAVAWSRTVPSNASGKAAVQAFVRDGVDSLLSIPAVFTIDVCRDDGYLPNQDWISSSTAPMGIDATICPGGGDDWFSFLLAPGEGVLLTAEHDPNDGAVGIEILDLWNDPLTSIASHQGVATMWWENPGLGSTVVYARIFATSQIGGDGVRYIGEASVQSL